MDFELDVPSVEDWYPILKWDMLPNFGPCHTHADPKRFLNEYYVTPELNTLYKNLCGTLSNNRNSTNIRIAGDPGAGKTTFLYALKKMADQGYETLRDFTFYIFHINKASDEDGTDYYKTEIAERIEEAWKLFFEEDGKSDDFERFKQQNLKQKALLNKLADFYLKNKPTFKKSLVFILDDVDLLPGEHVALVADSILMNLEVASVRKWIAIRGITYDNYSGSTKRKIEQFFPDHYQFPNVPLYDLVSHRIKSSSCREMSETARKPFSAHLCNELIHPVCEMNLREGLPLLKSILEDAHPGEDINASRSDGTIQKFIDKSAVNTLVRAQKITNLHADIFRVAVYPLAVDILCCSMHHTSENVIFAAVNGCIARRNAKCLDPISAGSRLIKVRVPDFNKVVGVLLEHGLLMFERGKNKEENRLYITRKGRVLSVFCSEEYYSSECAKKDPSPDSRAYWSLAKIQVDHQHITSSLVTWQVTDDEKGEG